MVQQEIVITDRQAFFESFLLPNNGFDSGFWMNVLTAYMNDPNQFDQCESIIISGRRVGSEEAKIIREIKIEDHVIVQLRILSRHFQASYTHMIHQTKLGIRIREKGYYLSHKKVSNEESIITISRIREGKTEFEEFDLNRWVRKMLEDLERRVSSRVDNRPIVLEYSDRELVNHFLALKSKGNLGSHIKQYGLTVDISIAGKEEKKVRLTFKFEDNTRETRKRV